MKRVVVTGMGIISALGHDIDTFWDNVKKGKVAIDDITRFDTTDYKVKLAAEIKEFDPAQFMDVKAAKRMELFASMQLQLQGKQLRVRI